MRDIKTAQFGWPIGMPLIKKFARLKMEKKHIGENFDDFLESENLLAESEAMATKRVISFQIEKQMKKEKITKLEMAKRMKTSRAALDRLLDPNNISITLQTLEKAAVTLGKRVKIKLV